MSSEEPVREVFVDYNHVGWAKRAHTRLFRDEREGRDEGRQSREDGEHSVVGQRRRENG